MEGWKDFLYFFRCPPQWKLCYESSSSTLNEKIENFSLFFLSFVKWENRENICRKFAQCISSHMLDDFREREKKIFLWSFRLHCVKFDFSLVRQQTQSWRVMGRRKALEKGHRMSDMKIVNERETLLAALNFGLNQMMSLTWDWGGRRRRGRRSEEGSFYWFSFSFSIRWWNTSDPLVAISRSNKKYPEKNNWENAIVLGIRTWKCVSKLLFYSELEMSLEGESEFVHMRLLLLHVDDSWWSSRKCLGWKVTYQLGQIGGN